METTGISISHFAGSIDFDILSQQVSFVFCKASRGGSFMDPSYRSYMSELANRGIIRGGYHFLTFGQNSAREQAANFLNTGTDFSSPGMLPPVLDIEWQIGGSTQQSESMNQYIKDNREASIQLAKDWLEHVERNTGRVPIIYTNKAFWQEFFINPAGFERYPLWIADYRPTMALLPSGWSNYTFRETGENSRVNGVSTPVYSEVFNGSVEDLRRMALL